MKVRSGSLIGFSLVTALLSGLLLFSACENNQTKPSASKDGSVSFSWLINYDWFSPPNNWGADVVSAWLKQERKLDIEWLSPMGAGDSRLNLMIATNELPDVINLDHGELVDQLIDAGTLLPIDDYLDQMPNLRRWAGKLNLELLRYKDGKIYQFPNWYINPDKKQGNGSAAWAINTRIYKELNSPPLLTFEDLDKYLDLVKAKYPDIIPLEPCEGNQASILMYLGQDVNMVNHLANALGTPQNGKFSRVFEDPRVRDTFVRMSRYFRNGLVSQDAFTQSRDQVMEKLINARVAVVASQDAEIIGRANRQNTIGEDLYEVIWPIAKKGIDASQVKISSYNTRGWNANVFTKKAADRLGSILKHLDWLTGEEGQRVLCYGPPGYFWDKFDEEGIPFWNSRYQNASSAEREQARLFNWNWVGNTSWVDIGKAVANKRMAVEHQDQMTRWQGDIIWKTSRDEKEFGYNNPPADSELGMINTMILDIYDEARTYSVFANSDAQVLSILDQAQIDMNQIGYDKYLDYHNSAWAQKKAQVEALEEK